MEIRNKLKVRFLKPSSKIGRWFNIFELLSVSIGSFIVFYIVQNDMCIGSDCKSFSATKIIITISPFFIVYGVTSLVVAYFLANNKNLAVLYANSITIMSMFGFLMMGLFVFSVQ